MAKSAMVATAQFEPRITVLMKFPLWTDLVGLLPRSFFLLWLGRMLSFFLVPAAVTGHQNSLAEIW
jgi:hypothetical protein